jgi:predicted Ser/Thr protein kinase
VTTQASPAPIPEKIGKYKVVRVLGRGSMGVVYLARDLMIDREVAIKTISLPEGLEEYKVKEFRERFLREARAAGRLNHPAIVTVYEADDGSGGGPPFIAMEYVEGLPWNYKIRQKILPDPEAVLPLIRDIASALDYAHRSGVVHRDIKPANIVQAPGGHVKLMDFGIAKVPTSELTREGQFLGTPAYMSPEQIQGRPVDGRADLFSLGTVLYELLTCTKPFPGDDITTVTFRILREDPPAASAINPALDPPVEQMLRKLLAKEPGDRYQSATELMQDIDAYMAGAALPHAGTADANARTDPKAAPVAPKPPAAPPPPPMPRPAAGAAASPAPAVTAAEETQASAGQDARRRSPFPLLAGLGALLVVSAGLLVAAILWYRSSRATESSSAAAESPPAASAGEGQAPPAEEANTLPERVLPGPQERPAFQEQAKEPPKPRPKPKAPPAQPPEDVLAAAEAIRQAEAKARAEAQKPPEPPAQPVSVSYTFRTGIVRGEFWIRVDGHEAVHQVVNRKFSFKQETYTGQFQIPPGTHLVSFEVKTELQDITGTHQESVTVNPGERKNLTIVMTKFNKELRFEWTG